MTYWDILLNSLKFIEMLVFLQERYSGKKAKNCNNVYMLLNELIWKYREQSLNTIDIWGARVAQWPRQLDYLTTHTSLSPIRRGFVPGYVDFKTGALDSQLQVIKFTSCLPMVGGSLWVLRLPPSLKLVAMIIAEIFLKVALNTINQIKSLIFVRTTQTDKEYMMQIIFQQIISRMDY